MKGCQLSNSIPTQFSLSSHSHPVFTLKMCTNKISKEGSVDVCARFNWQEKICVTIQHSRLPVSMHVPQCTHKCTELNDAVLFMNAESHHKGVNSNRVKMVEKLMDRLKEFVAAINVEPAWLFYFVGIGMFYMPSQVPI